MGEKRHYLLLVSQIWQNSAGLQDAYIRIQGNRVFELLPHVPQIILREAQVPTFRVSVHITLKHNLQQTFHIKLSWWQLCASHYFLKRDLDSSDLSHIHSPYTLQTVSNAGLLIWSLPPLLFFSLLHFSQPYLPIICTLCFWLSLYILIICFTF